MGSGNSDRWFSSLVTPADVLGGHPVKGTIRGHLNNLVIQLSAHKIAEKARQRIFTDSPATV
jgi:hypothetical protein